MKRYDFTSDDICHSGCRMEEFEDGQYVKWEDVKEQLSKTPKYPCGCSPLNDIEVSGKKQCACGFRR